MNYGMQEAARRYGVDLKVLEAGGYSQLATQQAQIDQCKQWGAEAILLGEHDVISRPAKAGSKSAGDRTGKCY
ncbi:hypothetical protein ACLK1Z_05910 [Escherichia coli]